MIPCESNAGFTEGADLPLGAIGSRERVCLQPTFPITARVLKWEIVLCRIVVEKDVVRDGAHHGMADVVIKERIVVAPPRVAEPGDRAGIAVEPLAVRCLITEPIAGIAVADVLESVEGDRLQEHVAPFDLASVFRLLRRGTRGESGFVDLCG